VLRRPSIVIAWWNKKTKKQQKFGSKTTYTIHHETSEFNPFPAFYSKHSQRIMPMTWLK